MYVVDAVIQQLDVFGRKVCWIDLDGDVSHCVDIWWVVTEQGQLLSSRQEICKSSAFWKKFDAFCMWELMNDDGPV